MGIRKWDACRTHTCFCIRSDYSVGTTITSEGVGGAHLCGESIINTSTSSMYEYCDTVCLLGLGDDGGRTLTVGIMYGVDRVVILRYAE